MIGHSLPSECVSRMLTVERDGGVCCLVPLLSAQQILAERKSLNNNEPGKMAQHLRTFPAVAEDLGSVPSAHVAAHNSLLTPVLGNVSPSSGLYRKQV